MDTVKWAEKVEDLIVGTHHSVQLINHWDRALGGALRPAQYRAKASSCSVRPRCDRLITAITELLPTLPGEDELDGFEKEDMVFTALIDLPPENGEHPLFLLGAE